MTVNIVAVSLQRKKACLSTSYSSCDGHDAYEFICICATKREGRLMVGAWCGGYNDLVLTYPHDRTIILTSLTFNKFAQFLGT
jgi:hypothetical protein